MEVYKKIRMTLYEGEISLKNTFLYFQKEDWDDLLSVMSSDKRFLEKYLKGKKIEELINNSKNYNDLEKLVQDFIRERYFKKLTLKINFIVT